MSEIKKRGRPRKNTITHVQNSSDLPDDAVTGIVKQKHKRPKRSENYQMHTEPGEMSRMIVDAMNLSDMGKVDMQDPAAVRERVNQFLQYCVERDMKPTVESMALAFNTNRMQLWRWKEGVDSGNIPESVRIEIRRGYSLMNQLLSQAMANGKINPVAAIFLLKNNHGYKDQTDVVVAPSTAYGSDNPDEVRDKYIEDVTNISAEGNVE